MFDQPQSTHPAVVVGIVREQPDTVLKEAIMFARHFDAELVLATADTSSYEVGKEPDGTVVAWSLDPDVADSVAERFEPGLEHHLEELLRNSGVPHSFHALAGDPAQQLAKLADELNAVAIVVGVRRHGLKAALHDFIEGSVAVHLAHRQHRPVIVIPDNPVGFDADLPWDKPTG